MTLDEAIKHAEEVAEEKENEGKLLCQSEAASIGCLTCAEEHRQLAEWLKDYKRLLEQEPCDAISREAVLSKIKEVCFSKEWTQFRVDKGSNGQRDFIIDYIEQLPSATQKTGKWIPIPYELDYETDAECSLCHEKFIDSINYDYCPKCGYRMQKSEDEGCGK